MKRVLISVIATVIGVVALLSFKTHGTSQLGGGAGSLPAATLPGLTASSQPASIAPVSTSAPPDPSPPAPDTSSGPSIAPPPATSAPASSAAAARSFLGSSITTRYGVVQVKITVAGHRITDVSFAKLTAFDGRSQQINQSAAPTLLQETLQAQSAHIDTVSGATYTSDGYIQSLQSALDQAGL